VRKNRTIRKLRTVEEHRPREGVWYAYARDNLFTVRHPDASKFTPMTVIYVCHEETAMWVHDAERAAIAAPDFYVKAVFIGEF